MDATSTHQDDLADETPDTLLGRTVGGRFRVLRTLGRGGMGAVYEVEHGGGRAALKIIARDAKSTDARALRRFEREAKLAAEIDHVHVTRTLELGSDDELGAPFLLMELLSGHDLGAVIDERAPLSPEVAARIGVQAARGLAAAHARGVVHRDVKPQNLFLHEQGGELTVKVCDFGIAKLSEPGPDEDASSLTNSGGIIGSPRYMSPEQAQGDKTVDARTDVWSLCASLYEALSGRRLWSAEALGELIVAICTRPVPRLSVTAPWVPAALASVIHRGLARSRAERWADMAALEAALLPCTGGTVVVHASDLESVPSADREHVTTSRAASTRADTTHAPAALSVERAKSPWLGLGLGAAAAVLAGAALFTTSPSRTDAAAASSPPQVERGEPATSPPQAPGLPADAPAERSAHSPISQTAWAGPSPPPAQTASAMASPPAVQSAKPAARSASPPGTNASPPGTNASPPSGTAKPAATSTTTSGGLPTTEDWR